MQLRCRLVFEYETEDHAKNIAQSISLDNGKFAEAEVRGRELIITINSPSAPSMLNTLEDLLSCLRVAEQTVRIGSGPDPLPNLDS